MVLGSPGQNPEIRKTAVVVVVVRFEYGNRNADRSRILEFADGLNLVICNTLFMKQKSQLVTYAADPVESTVHYIIAQQEDKAKACNVKVCICCVVQ